MPFIVLFHTFKVFIVMPYFIRFNFYPQLFFNTHYERLHARTMRALLPVKFEYAFFRHPRHPPYECSSVTSTSRSSFSDKRSRFLSASSYDFTALRKCVPVVRNRSPNVSISPSTRLRLERIARAEAAICMPRKPISTVRMYAKKVLGETAITFLSNA